jgi:hypothetical protein
MAGGRKEVTREDGEEERQSLSRFEMSLKMVALMVEVMSESESVENV